MQILINSQGLNMNPLQSLYYISPACLVCLAVPLGEALHQWSCTIVWRQTNTVTSCTAPSAEEWVSLWCSAGGGRALAGRHDSEVLPGGLPGQCPGGIRAQSGAAAALCHSATLHVLACLRRLRAAA